jgi:hypothetical protein
LLTEAFGRSNLARVSQVLSLCSCSPACQSNPLATLYNGADLPAVPFRTDNWPLTTEKNK